MRKRSTYTITLMKQFKNYLQCLKELENNYTKKNFNDMDGYIITINWDACSFHGKLN